MQLLKASWLVLQDLIGPTSLVRTPEPTAEMSDPNQVHAFHAQGEHAGVLLGVYHFNARAVHALTPQGGTVLDLGCGSGQFLCHLARVRPDLRLIGLDLSPPMIELGRDMVRRARLSERVDLRIGDMTKFADEIRGRVDTVVSVFSLHHLPTEALLEACCRQIASIHSREGAALWIFDHARPRKRRTAAIFPKVFTPHAPALFNSDSENSLMAAWSFQELSSALELALDASMRCMLPRIFPFYQAHWIAPRPVGVTAHARWEEATLPRAAKKDLGGLRGLFRGCPGADGIP